jgi:hypothetical protein
LTLNTSIQLRRAIFIIAILLLGVLTFSGVIFPGRVYESGQKVSKIEVIVSERPFLNYKGFDGPHYYVIMSQNFSNEFHISDEVLYLVEQNEAISRAVKEIRYGDTLSIYITDFSASLLNQKSQSIEIVGLAKNKNILIDPKDIEKYYQQHRANNRFGILVIGIIFFFIIKKQIKTNKEAK